MSVKLQAAGYKPQAKHYLERAAGIEPASSAWKAEVLPLNYARLKTCPLLKATACTTGFHIYGAGGWIRTTEARASDLQSDPFGHSGTPAKFNFSNYSLVAPPRPVGGLLRASCPTPFGSAKADQTGSPARLLRQICRTTEARAPGRLRRPQIKSSLIPLATLIAKQGNPCDIPSSRAEKRSAPPYSSFHEQNFAEPLRREARL